MRIAQSRGITAMVGMAAALLLPFAAAPAPVAEAQTSDEVGAYRRAVEARFSAWLTALWPDAQAAGVSQATFDANLKGLKFNWSLPHLVLPDPAAPGGPPLPPALKEAAQPQHQPEFDVPEGYFKDGTLMGLASQGRAKTAEWRPQLAEIEMRYGVPASIVVAIWGRETGFGKIDAPYDALAAIATQGFMGRRPEEFRKQLIVALKILSEGHATRAQMKSSWAGAMGYTQFMPTDFENYAVDFDGDGKRDIWGSIADSLASTGNSLHAQGWDGTKPWGYEVRLPKGFDCTLQGPDQARPVAEWVKLGVAPVSAEAGGFPQAALAEPTFLVLPAGLKGPAFLATNNFAVLKLYNNSDVYAIFVGHVADMIATNVPVKFAGTWQPVERFTQDRMQRFQEALVARGYDVGNVDGLAGFKTRQAIGLTERKLGLPLTCYPNSAVIDAVLKAAGAAAQ
jgi:lytic murein transglycosylase